MKTTQSPIQQKKKSIQKKQIRIVIERSDDSYSAYAESIPGVYGHADTVEEAKNSALKGIELLKKYNQDENIPEILKGDYEIIYKFDAKSFLNFYKKTFTNAALERMTHINQKQFHHYATGLKKPRPAQVKKIEAAMHQLGRELLSIEL
ncbi:MAG: type II toxin-antitoxin system HicB family antitoxin [Ferruginibacter sp.]